MIRITRDAAPTKICREYPAKRSHNVDAFCIRYEPNDHPRSHQAEVAFDRAVIRAVFHAEGTPFFAIAPVTAEVRASDEIMSHVSDVLLDSALGYLGRSPSEVEAHLAVRRRISSYEEWVVGCCTEQFVKPTEAKWFQKAIVWDTEVFCSQFHRISTIAVYYGETGEATLWTPSFPELTEILHSWL